MRAVVVIAAGLAALGVVAAGIVTISTLRWRRATSAAIAALHSSHATRQLTALSGSELAALPPVVARYFRFALPAGQRSIARASITQRGEIALGGSQGWRPFDAIEEFQVDQPGFVWSAAIHMAPLADVLVRDSYMNGAGAMRGRIVGLIPVVDLHGTAVMAEASLQRYLAEAVWLPTALLPSAGVVWTSVDEHIARATLTDGSVSASFDFEFAADGAILGGTAMRYRDAGGRMVRATWDGRFTRYQRVHGMMVPMHGDVGWMLPEGRTSYWRGDLLRVDYELR